MLYYYRKSKNAEQTRKTTCATYGEEIVNDRPCQFWFVKFRTGNFSSKTFHVREDRLRLMRIK